MADPTLPGADPSADPNAPAAPTAGPTPKNANELALMCAMKFGVGTEDFAGMWTAINGGADVGAGLTGGDTTMADDKAPDVTLARDDKDAKLTAAEARIAALELAAQTAAAEAKVDHDIGARSLPVGVRPVLVKLALQNETELYASVLDNAKPVPTAERGTTGGVNLSASSLTETERQAAKDMGYDPEALAKWKAAQADAD